MTVSTLDRRFAELRDAYERLAELPGRPHRSAAQQSAGAEALATARDRREVLLRDHAGEVYAELTDDNRVELRLAELVAAAAARFPGLVPSPAELAAEGRRPQRDKDGLEVDVGVFVAHLLARPRSGFHLIGAMARPGPDAESTLAAMRDTDSLDLGTVRLDRVGHIGHVTLQTPAALNAEDDDTTVALEAAIDWVLLDDRVQLGVLRGGPVDHPKWRGRRLFGSGVNLTRLYRGEISLITFFLQRELSVVDKLYRGHAVDAPDRDGREGRREKPWIAAVDGFAIGGACQLMLVMDWVVADAGSYFSLPAGREGIVPGCGPLRLPRLVGEMLAREALLFNRTFPAGSPEGALLAGDVVPAEELDGAVAGAADALLECGPESVRANRRALRVAVEPLDVFRHYLATYAAEQARCLHSPALIRNLERTWINR